MPFDNPRTDYLYIVRSELEASADEDEWQGWYDDVHLPDLLSVPGFRSATRYRERGAERRHLAVYEIDDPGVFEQPRYQEIRGWHYWEPHVEDWTRWLLKRVPRDGFE